MKPTAQYTRHGRWERGFTLIEIVLVLAIAGLILIVVFFAVAGAQRARRDLERKNDASRVAAAINAYASQHNSLNPDDAMQWADFYTNYIDAPGTFKDPATGATYVMPFRDRHTSNHSDIPAVGEIFVQGGHWCNAGDNADLGNPTYPIAGDDVNLNQFAVWVGLEAGGNLDATGHSGAWYCVDGQ